MEPKAGFDEVQTDSHIQRGVPRLNIHSHRRLRTVHRYIVRADYLSQRPTLCRVRFLFWIFGSHSVDLARPWKAPFGHLAQSPFDFVRTSERGVQGLSPFVPCPSSISDAAKLAQIILPSYHKPTDQSAQWPFPKYELFVHLSSSFAEPFKPSSPPPLPSPPLGKSVTLGSGGC